MLVGGELVVSVGRVSRSCQSVMSVDAVRRCCESVVLFSFESVISLARVKSSVTNVRCSCQSVV